MITEMGWTPESLPNSGHTATTRCQLVAAIALFNLYDEVAVAETQRDQADTVVDPWADTVEAPRFLWR
jgi:hypothetical protein